MLVDRIVYQLPIGPVIACAGEHGWRLYTAAEWAANGQASYRVDRHGRILSAGQPTGWTVADLEESLTATALAMLDRRLALVSPPPWTADATSADSA